LEGMYENKIEDCSFIDYTSWAIQEQTWSANIYPQNTFVADMEAPGDIAWWGYVTVDASGTGIGSLKGASLVLRSEIGEYRRTPGRIDVIWGYSDGSDPIPVVYEGEVKWGTSSARFELDPEAGLIRTVEVPLGDISLISIERDRGDFIVILGMSGTGSVTADMKVYLDDEEVLTESTTLRSGDEVSIRIPITFTSGTHTVRAHVSSPDEYHGGDLLENNEMSETFSVDNGRDTEIALWAFVAVLFLVLAAAIVNEFGFKRV
jgi:nitrate reductase NapE component